MSNSIVRRTVWITAGVWAVLILAVHGGHVRSRHWRGNGHRVVAEPPAGCQRERLKW